MAFGFPAWEYDLVEDDGILVGIVRLVLLVQNELAELNTEPQPARLVPRRVIIDSRIGVVSKTESPAVVGRSGSKNELSVPGSYLRAGQ